MSTPQPGREGSRAAERRRTEVFATPARPTTAPDPPPPARAPPERPDGTGQAAPVHGADSATAPQRLSIRPGPHRPANRGRRPPAGGPHPARGSRGRGPPPLAHSGDT